MAKIHAAAVVVLALVAVACAPVAEQHSVITTDRNGLRTFSIVTEVDGNPVVCPAFALVDPVIGNLEGDPAGRPDTVWLDRDGRRLSVVWPGGFTVRFGPGLTLMDDHGTAVAFAGDVVTLHQVRSDSHAGTFEDPYIASGALFDGCYTFIP